QEDKEAIFDSIETVKKCLSIFAPMIATMRVLKENMYKAAQEGFINATDLADYLVRKGLPFRSAYKIVGQIVGYCIENGLVLDNMPLPKYKEFSELFDNDLYNEISLETCVEKRISAGGTGKASIETQIEYVKSFC
ncbi:MAG: argininosuccinate lyase, partial [Clostridia bacterium]|nr:argininosuccinate lyase [Clostridia bacterium]